MIVKLGKYDLSVKNERDSITQYVSDIILHPQWDPRSQVFHADIAIIILETKVENSRIIPICLSLDDEDLDESRGIIVGWGQSEFATSHENKPREIELEVFNNADCFEKSPQFIEISSNNTFCAGKDIYSGPCRGDSGSGFFIKRNANQWFLKGVVSAGFSTETGCDVSVDVLFTDVTKYTQWIRGIADDFAVELPTSQKQHLAELIKPKSFDKEIFCFFESGADSRTGDGAFTLNQLKPELCTTLVFLEAELDDANDDLKSNDPWQQVESNGKQLYKHFNELKEAFALRTLLSVGSWSEGSAKFSNLSADPKKRKRFATNSADFLKMYNFDGLHLNLVHYASQDKENFLLLIKDIKAIYDKQNLFLSAIINTRDEHAYDLVNIAAHVDKLLLFTFDFYGSCHDKIEFPAALKGEGSKNVLSKVDTLITQGVPAHKIIMGFPFFGRIFGSTLGKIGEVSAAGPFGGPFSNVEGFVGYNEICYYRKNYENENSYDANSSQAILQIDGGEVALTVLYDSPRSVVNKVKFLVERQLAGAWVAYASTDDFRGECSVDREAFSDFKEFKVPPRETTDFPLLRTLNKAMELFTSKESSDVHVFST